MDIINNNCVITIEQKYPLVYNFEEQWDAGSSHEAIAKWLFDNKEHISTYMLIVESELLADEHRDDPNYLQQTHHICVSKAESSALDHLQNKWFTPSEIDKFISKYKWPITRYNYQDDDARSFKFELEDALFQYQKTKDMVLSIIEELNFAKFAMDDDGYLIEDDDDQYIPVTDKSVIEQNREKILEYNLVPQVHTTYDRVYAMPEPFNHWDYRSFWHQFFFVENHKTKQTLYKRGQGGGSGSREENGKWAHTFAELEKVYGVKTPTWHLVYTEHNILRLQEKYNSFKSFNYDLTGNYAWDYKKSHKLFDGMLIPPIRKSLFDR